MASRIQYATDCRFQRPGEVCRAHFLDMRHHIEHGVHKGVHYTILEESASSCRVRQELKVLGLTKVDELVLSRRADGGIRQDYVAGDFDFPLRGLNRLLAPIILRTVKKLTAQALEEDRADLEEGEYQPTGWAAAQARA